MSAIDEGNVTAEILEEHMKKISWLQHERLVHLIVTAMAAFAELFAVDLTLLHPELGIVPVILMLILFVFVPALNSGTVGIMVPVSVLFTIGVARILYKRGVL